MGVGVQNCTLRAHRAAGTSASDYHLHVHQQSPPEDSESPGFDQDGYEDLHAAAAQTQATFDGVASALLGSWYDQRSTDFKATIKGVIAAL